MSRAETPQTWNVVTTVTARAQKTLNRAEMRAPTSTREMREATGAVNATFRTASTEQDGAIVARRVRRYHITFEMRVLALPAHRYLAPYGAKKAN